MTEQIRIKISAAEAQNVRDLMNEERKIAAIKLLRAKGKSWPGKTVEELDGDGNATTKICRRPGLRDAKEAVEVMAGTRRNSEAQAVIVPGIRIKKVIVEGEHGDIEMDLDQLQLRLLDGLGIVPMEEIAAMTELMTFIREWSGE